MSKNVVITGGASGIGRVIVDYLKELGARPIVLDCLPQDHDAVKQLQQQDIFYVQTNVADRQSVIAAFEKINEYVGTQSAGIDVLVNNAGITRDGLALRLSEQDWDAVVDVNLKGTFLCSQQALKYMVRQSKSYIVNIASVVGVHGNPGQVNYAASKAGVIALTKTLAQEYASRNVLVNAIAPGFIQTAMTDRLSADVQQAIKERIALQRFGDPMDVAYLVAFFISGHADYMTGQVVHLDGGMA